MTLEKKMKNTFENMNLKKEIIVALKRIGITKPTVIQEKSIPLLYAGKDIIMESQTGSGKTLAYLLPIYEKIDLSLRSTQAVILVPTHELALQVQDVAKSLSKSLNQSINSAIIMGNVNINRQVEVLKSKPQIVIGTSGRIFELIKKRKIAAHTVKTIVIDEADRLLDTQNLEQTKAVIKTTLRDRQLVFVSASIPPNTIKTIGSLTEEFTHIKAVEETTIPAQINHQYIVVDKRDKLTVLRSILTAVAPKKAIIFTSQSDNINVIHEKLLYHNYKLSYLYGGLMKAQRTKELHNFKSGKTNLLLATDIAARGLHFDNIDYVIHLNIAESSEEYVHRAGRTGRNNKKGTSICIVTEREIAFLKQYEKELKFKFQKKRLIKGTLK